MTSLKVDKGHYCSVIISTDKPEKKNNMLTIYHSPLSRPLFYPLFPLTSLSLHIYSLWTPSIIKDRIIIYQAYLSLA